MIKRFALILFVFFAVGILINKSVKADGTYYNIGTSTSNDGSPDAVSWSTGNPIVIDSYGHLIVPTQQTGQTAYDLSFSNDKGVTWDVNTTTNIPGRPAVAYDAVNDNLLALSADGGNGDVVFRRYIIRRDVDYNISDITLDTSFTPLLLDDQGTCADDTAGDPVLLIKDIDGTNRALAFWSVSKTNCSGDDISATRAATLVITNTASDGNGASWGTLTGDPSAGGNGPANVNYTQIYLSPTVEPFFQQSALIKSADSNINDIYYFNIDENGVHEFRRFSYNSGTGIWSNGVTAPALFGGSVNDSQGYNLKRELLSKPVEATGQDRVYVGIARWLDNTNGDTQSLFYADNTDAMNLAGNVYSAAGTHCIYPTFDIAYDQVQNQVYTFYDISGIASVCGNVYYKTFDGSTLGAATPFYTQANRSVDIPIVFQNRFDDKLQLFFRLNNAVTPGTPPHEIYYGNISLNSNQVPPNTPSSGVNNNEDVAYADFNKVCADINDLDIYGDGFASVKLKTAFLDEFETPTNPYKLVYNDKWDIPSTWGAGLYEPKPNGNVNIYTTNGAYLISRPTFTPSQSFSFVANFTQKNFEHVGLVDSSGFNQYIIFSTGADGILKARTSDGGEVNTVIGTGFYNSFHTYTINWTPANLDFLIDDVNVATFTTNIPTNPLRIILSNNDHSAGSDLFVQSLRTDDYSTASGTYTSCPIDSGITDADWLVANYGATIGGGQTIQFQVRTSDDLNAWSGWSSALNTGNNIPSPLGRYAQYLVTLTSASSTSSPEVYDVNLTFAPPVPPDAVNDVGITNKDTAVDINVLTNDTITTALDGSSPSITVAAAHGTAVVTNLAGGVVTYTPTAGYSGADVFTYQICDTNALCDTATGSITIRSGPVTSPESVSVANDTSIDISVLSNDSDSDGTIDPSTLTITTPASHGDTSINTTTGVITYTPTAGYVGSDSFIYRVCDNHAICANGTVSLTINDATEETPTPDDSTPNNGVGNSSGTTSETCAETKPGVPTILTAISTDPSKINVKYKAGSGVFTKFDIEITKLSQTYKDTDITKLDKTVLEYNFSNLTATTTYFFRIRAENGCATSDWSSEFKAVTAVEKPTTISVSDDINKTPVSSPVDQGGFKTEYLLIICCPLAIVLLIILASRKKKDKKTSSDYNERFK